MKQGPNTCYVALRGLRLISYSSRTRSGTPLFITYFGYFLTIGNILTKFEKKSIERIFFKGKTLILWWSHLCTHSNTFGPGQKETFWGGGGLSGIKMVYVSNILYMYNFNHRVPFMLKVNKCPTFCLQYPSELFLFTEETCLRFTLE